MPTTHPLVYGVLELRVPFSPTLTAVDSAHRLAALLRDALPVLRQEPSPAFIPDNPIAGGVLTMGNPSPAWRLLDRESTRSLRLTATSISFETTRYPGYASFREEVKRCLEAINEVASPVGIDRLGLRYVNEVRPEATPTSYEDWGASVSPGLITTFAEVESAITGACSAEPGDDCRLLTSESTLVFSLPQNTALTLRMANLDGPGVVGNDPLRRLHVPNPGPFFVVDFDGYWPREATEVRSFDVDDVLSLMEQVHSPVKSGFGWATTAAYRSDAGVRNEEGVQSR